MAGSSSSSKGEFAISIGIGRSEEGESSTSNYKDPKAVGAEKPDDDGVAPTSSHQQQQHSSSTNDEISSHHQQQPSSVQESRPLEEEEEEEEEEEVLEIQVNALRILVVAMVVISVCTFILAAHSPNKKITTHRILEFELRKWFLLLMVILHGINGIIALTYIRDCRIFGRFRSNKMIRDLVIDFVRDSLVSVHILIVFIVWMSLFNRRVSSKTEARILHYVTKTLASLLIGSCLWTLKTMLVVTVASKFRIKDFLEKIADVLSNKYLLKALSKPPPPVMEPMPQEAAAAAGGKMYLKALCDYLKAIPFLEPLRQVAAAAAGGLRRALSFLFNRNYMFLKFLIVGLGAAAGGGPLCVIPLLPIYVVLMIRIKYLIVSLFLDTSLLVARGPHRLSFSFSFSFLPKREKIYVNEGSKGVEELRARVKRLIKKENQIIKDVSYPTLLFLTHNVLETELSIINNPSDDIERQTDFKITNEWEAETAADRIFSNVARADPKYMNADELLRILPKKDVKTLHSQVHGTDDPSDGRISKIALRQWVIFREHKALTSSSSYHNAVVKQLGQFMECFLLLLVFIIWLLLIDYPTPKIQVLLSLLLGASFIFGNTCKNIFEGIIYVVFMHPFDIGDLCVVDDGQVLVVEGGDIYTTAFSDVDTDEKVFYANSLLCSKPIKNYTRSPDMKVTLKIIIDNPGQKLQDQKEFIERRIVEYLKSQPKQWQPCPVLYEMKETVDAEELTIVLHCFRKMSLQNWKERVSQKNMLKKEIKKITEELLLEFSVAEQATTSSR